ncbi:MAG: M1 family metallopeptidase [Planctomycetes bacterium]|nr:M1 family metallopeptidase [Planctomycetota bacterium]
MRTTSRAALAACLFPALFSACQLLRKAPSTPAPAALVPQAQPIPERSFPIDVESYSLELELLPAERAVRGHERLRFVVREAGITQIALDLAGLAVERVRDRDGAALRFRQEAECLLIDFPRPLARGDARELAIDYAGKPQRGLWFVSEKDGVPRQVFTQGACDDARAWFPCVDHPSERASSELIVRMPRAWKAICAGERIERREEGDFAIERWRANFPHPSYLETLCAGEFAEKQAQWDGLPLAYLAAPELEPLIDPSFDETGPVLSFFSRLTGRRYPYPKYAQVCVAEFPFGGMENISATTLTENALVDERGVRDAPMASLVAHEAAHQWFGDLVTCADWGDAWLNEGFATYFTALYTAQSQGPDAFALALDDMQRSDAASKEPRAVVWDRCVDPMDLFTGRIYAGAAVRLHLLRGQLGDAVFFTGIRNYLAENAGKSVRTSDLRGAFERASGRDLTRFFEQWLRSPGQPDLAVAWKWDEARKQLVVTVDQRQPVEDGTPSAFETPAELEILVGKQPRFERLELHARKQIFQFACAEKPRWVRFDPHGWIPKTLVEQRSDAEWLDLAVAAPEAPARRAALHELARMLKDGSKEVSREELLAALVERSSEERVARVRAEALTALALAQEPAAREALALAAEKDPEACARVAALNALAALPADETRAALAERVFEQGYSWNTMSAALHLYAQADPAGAWPVLERAFAQPSPHDTLASAVLPLLVANDAARARALCVATAADRERPAPLRAAAATALASYGARDREAAQALDALLQDPAWVVRRSAIDALAKRADKSARAALAARWERTELPRERRTIEAIFEKAKPASK